MSFAAKVVLDSINPDRQRLCSVVATYPRFIHAEIMTHRDRARNAASSRAIPWKAKRKKMVNESDGEYAANLAEGGLPALSEKCMYRMISENPVIPIKWGAEQKGMQTGDQIPPHLADLATKLWLIGRDQMLKIADMVHNIGETYEMLQKGELEHLGLYGTSAQVENDPTTKIHKSLANRLTEPWMWITVLMTATEWNNFFRLRVHPDAEIHFQKIAGMIKDAMRESIPKRLAIFEWHTPFVDDDEKNEIVGAWKAGRLNVPIEFTALECIKRISAGRCARLSYLTHDGKRDWNEDIGLATKLINRSDNVIHASPLEHVARSSDKSTRSGPFKGWFQFRKEFANENVEG